MSIPVSNTLKTIYKNDRFPLVPANVPKELEAYFEGLDLTIDTGDFADDKGEFELTEGICMEEQLRFGACTASQVKFTAANITDDIKGEEFDLTQRIIADEEYEMPLGLYTVDTATKQDDLIFKDIVAYDRMKKIDIDVAAWYNSLAFPMTLGAFRASFLAYVGLVEDTANLPLPNDSMTVEKTISAAQLPGRKVIEAAEELNGVFGQVSRANGKFKHVILKPIYGDYPTNDYPTNDYPISESDTSYTQPNLIDETITVGMREKIRFAEYTVAEIDKLIIRAEEADIGAIVGTGTNAYVIEGNFLVFGKSAAELQIIARNAYGYIAKRPYRPFESNGLGLPYLEPGDMLEFSQDDPVMGYMFKRTLRGIQSLRDEYVSKGPKERKQVTAKNTEIINLQYKVTKLKLDVDGVLVEVSDLAEGVSSQLSIMSGQISLKVDSSGIIAAINLSPETVKIEATNIALEGIVTANNNFRVLLDGSIEAVNGKFSGQITASSISGGSITGTTINGGTITGTSIIGGSISGTTFTQTGSTHSVTISNGTINASLIQMSGSGGISSQISAGNIILINGSDSVTLSGAGLIAPTGFISVGGPITIGGNTVIHSGTISSQYVRGVTNGSRSAYMSANDNFIPSFPGMYIGSSGSYWAGAYLGSGPVVVSDKNKKHDINTLPDKYIKFAKKIIPRMFKYNDGTSGRTHLGFIAQEVEEAMLECEISDMEFAGLIKSPVYSRKLSDENGNETPDYDTTSEIIDYDYGLRMDEFIPLLFSLLERILNPG